MAFVPQKRNILASAEDTFTDREEPRRAFWKVYDKFQQGSVEILSYYGHGGLGKTTLLKKIGSEIEEKVENGICDYTIYSFENDSTKEDFLYYLSRQMMIRNKGLKFPLLDAALISIATKEGKDIYKYSEEKNKSIMDNKFIGIAQNIITQAIPTSDFVFQTVSSLIEIGKSVKEEIEKKKYNNYFSQIESMGKEQLEETLQDYFVQDVYDYFSTREKPFVVFIDGYEKFVKKEIFGDKADLDDLWLRNGLIGIPNTIWVLAGREAINWPEDLLTLENRHILGTLSDIDAASYFNKSGIDDAKLINELIRISDGTPVFMDLCVKQYSNIKSYKQPTIDDFGKNTEELAEKFLKNMDDVKTELLKIMACFPNVWELDLMKNVMEEMDYGNYQIQLETLLKLTLIEKLPEGYRLHEVIRKVILNLISEDRKDCIYNQAASYYFKRIISSDKKTKRRNMLLNIGFYFSEKPEALKFSEADIRTVLDVIAYETKISGDYKSYLTVIKPIAEFFNRLQIMDIIRVKANNIYSYNLHKLDMFYEGEKVARLNYEFANINIDENSLDKIDTLHYLGLLDCKVGNISEAKTLLNKCYEDRIRYYDGNETEATLLDLNYLAYPYFLNEEHEKANALMEKCLAGRKKILGENHPDTLKAMDNQAIGYYHVGKIKEAIELLMPCYAKKIEILGMNHPDTLKSMNNLAMVNFLDNNIDNANQIETECFEIWRRIMGNDSLDTLKALNNLAVIKYNQNEYDIAARYFYDIYEIRNRKLGTNHINTKKVRYNLAKTYIKLGCVSEADSILQEIDVDNMTLPNYYDLYIDEA